MMRFPGLNGLSKKIGTLLALSVVSLLLIPISGTTQPPDEGKRLVGGWDITVRTSGGDAYSWLEVDRSGATLVGRFVGRVGSARPISRVEFAQGVLRFSMPRQYENREMQFEGRLDGDRLVGTVSGYDKAQCEWSAKRTPK